jgi:hypothetical protein
LPSSQRRRRSPGYGTGVCAAPSPPVSAAPPAQQAKGAPIQAPWRRCCTHISVAWVIAFQPETSPLTWVFCSHLRSALPPVSADPPAQQAQGAPTQAPWRRCCTHMPIAWVIAFQPETSPLTWVLNRDLRSALPPVSADPPAQQAQTAHTGTVAALLHAHACSLGHCLPARDVAAHLGIVQVSAQRPPPCERRSAHPTRTEHPHRHRGGAAARTWL